MAAQTLGSNRLPVFLSLLVDVCIVVLCAYLATYIRFESFRIDWPNATLIVIQSQLVMLLSFLLGVYNPWRGRSLRERMRTILVAWSLSFAVLLVLIVATKTAETFSRIWMAVWAIACIVSVVLFRLVQASLLKQLRRQGRNSKKVLVVGTGRNYHDILQQFQEGNDFGFHLAKVIAFESKKQARSEIKQVIKQKEYFDECWVCLPLKDSGAVKEIMFFLQKSTMDIRFFPGMRDMPLLNHKVTPIGGFFSLDLSCSPLDGGNQYIKAAEDFVIALFICLLILPVCMAIAIAIKLTSRGPVLFKQYRHGANGKPIKVYKFRSMKVHQEKKGEITQATKNDPRLTPIGSFLRRASLDELPQFFNVIQGRMSIVGPRPHALEHNEYYMDLVESYMQRHKVKPGITGLAQVRGYRGETDTLEKMEKRVECDLEYMNNWSVWLDIKIILLTVLKGFTGKTAY